MAALRALLLVLLLLLIAPSAALAAGAGTLLIVGGGLRPENAAVYRAFLEARPPGAPGILIIAAASGEPSRSAAYAAAAMRAHGAAAGDIFMAEVAMANDPGSPADESAWAGGADRVPDLARVGAVWFTGGDQSRITATLIGPDGADRPLLSAIRARLAGGAVIGGTSAGAAIMTDPMIASGIAVADAPVSLLKVGESGRDEGPVALAPGLGFLPGALSDQHFGERRRLGRLLQALAAPPAAGRTGLGIDEDTALVVDLASGEARVVGRGTVWRVEAGTQPPAVRRYRQGERFSLTAAAGAPRDD